MKKRTSNGSSTKSSSLRHHWVPAGVWLMTVAVIFGLFYRRTQQIQVLGVAYGKTHSVAATCTGRIHEVTVQLYDQVRQGQTLVTIDTLSEDERIANEMTIKELLAEQATLESSIALLEDQIIEREKQLVDQAVRTQADRAGDERIFSVGVETAKMQVLDLDRQLTSEKSVLGNLEDEIQTLEYLVKEKAISPFELDQAKRRYDRLEKKIEDYTKLRAEAQENLDEAFARQKAFLALPSSPLAGDMEGIVAMGKRIHQVAEKEMKVQQQRLREIEQRLTNRRQARIIPLKAPFDGVISHLFLSAGEVVDVNTPALQLAQANPREVIAYVPEAQANRVKPGMTVEVVKAGQPMQIAKNCEVIAVGPVIEQLPHQLWRHPNIAQWGRSFIVQIPEDMHLLLGEKVGIREL